jgi:Kef-type K+ transport system membrane component KefB
VEIHLVNFALVLGAALLGGAIARKLGYPAILGELIAGIAAGPAALGVLSPDEALSVVGTVGVLVMMLYVGLHLDLGDLQRASWPALLAAVGGFVVPAGAGYWLMTAVGVSGRSALFVAIAMGVTSLATKSRILVDLKILDTRVAHVMMTGALFADLAALIAFSALLGTGDGGDVTGGAVAFVAVKALLFTAAAFTVGLRLFPIGARLLVRHRADRGTVLLVVVIVAMLFGAAAEAAGLHGILGTFFAGLLMRPGLVEPRVFRDVEQLIYRVSVGLFAPVFFVMAGFHVDLGVIAREPLLLAAVIVFATVGKVVGTAVFYLPSGFGWREGVTVGSGMNGRGAVEVIVAEIALAGGLIDQTTFSILVLMALVTTALVPYMLTRCVAWLRSRGELVRTTRRRGTILVGAGPVARAIADELGGEGEVRLIDTNLDRCVTARDCGFEAIHGNAFDTSILRQAGAADAARIVCVTANSSVNVLVAQRAATEFGVPSASVLLTDGDAAALREGLDGDVRPLAECPVDLELWNRRVAAGTAVLAPAPQRRSDVVVVGDPAEPEFLPLFARGPDGAVPLAEVALNDLDRLEIIGLRTGGAGSGGADVERDAIAGGAL